MSLLAKSATIARPWCLEQIEIICRYWEKMGAEGMSKEQFRAAAQGWIKKMSDAQVAQLQQELMAVSAVGFAQQVAAIAPELLS